MKEHSILYYKNILHGINRIHDNEVNDIERCDLLHDILNASKYTKYISIQNSPIINGCINIYIKVEWNLMI